MSCCMASSCSSFSTRAASAAISVMVRLHTMLLARLWANPGARKPGEEWILRLWESEFSTDGAAGRGNSSRGRGPALDEQHRGGRGKQRRRGAYQGGHPKSRDEGFCGFLPREYEAQQRSRDQSSNARDRAIEP